MALLLAGDIGGTKTILRLAEATDRTSLQTLHEVRYSSHEFPDLVPMVQTFLKAAELVVGHKALPEKACFAIAGPVTNNRSHLTNLGWTLEAKRLETELNLSEVSLINDFAAVGHGVLGLAPTDLHTLQAGEPKGEAPIALIGAGTGLGQGFVLHQGANHTVYPSEGGHTDFAPRSELEFQLLRYLLEKHQIQRVSVERVVSGQGIVSIYQFLRDRRSMPESPRIQQVMRTWEQETGRSEKTVDPAAVITAAALEKQDYLAQQTLQVFVEAYGAEAGNLALKLLPYGGMFIAGGIAPKILPLLQNGSFLNAFLHKGRMSALLEQVPVQVVLNAEVGLIGAMRYAAQL